MMLTVRDPGSEWIFEDTIRSLKCGLFIPNRRWPELLIVSPLERVSQDKTKGLCYFISFDNNMKIKNLEYMFRTNEGP